VSWIKDMFSSSRRLMQQAREHIDEMDELIDDFEKDFSAHDEAAKAPDRETAAPAPGETVTTHREETRPDGTRIVTTVTETGAVVTRETKADGTQVVTTTTRKQTRQVVTKESR
jgi:hypothetical protein